MISGSGLSTGINGGFFDNLGNCFAGMGSKKLENIFVLCRNDLYAN